MQWSNVASTSALSVAGSLIESTTDLVISSVSDSVSSIIVTDEPINLFNNREIIRRCIEILGRR